MEKALKNGIISFDKEVFLTELMEEYEVPCDIVHSTLQNFIACQEKEGFKYKKRFLITGNTINGCEEIHTIAKESKLKEWNEKLHYLKSLLYSVELDSAVKSVAYNFRPMGKYKFELTSRELRKNCSFKSIFQHDEGFSKKEQPLMKLEIAKETPKVEEEYKTEKVNVPKTSTLTKKRTQETTNKKHIGNFFKTGHTKNNVDNEAGNISKASFFKNVKKETDKISEIFEEKLGLDKSLQIFEEEKCTEEKVSDEEDRLNTLKVEGIPNLEENGVSLPTGKRRRIEDSDDEETLKKHDKKEIKTSHKSEMYLDEEGFVITVKSKNPESTTTNTKSKSPAKSKTSRINQKTKQGNIMNFFNKK